MNPSMSITDLPQPITVDILSRLPTKTIITCKCVCKTWLSLLQEPYFANLHLSRSPTSLVIYQPGCKEPDSDTLKLVEFGDDLDCHDLRYDPAMKFDLGVCHPNGQILLVGGSVNGFLCFCDYQTESLFICNPTKREFIALSEPTYRERYPSMIVYGFGFSSVSGMYKVVQIFQKALSDPALELCSYECYGEVYTLGTGKWRSVGIVPFEYDLRTYSVSLNGNIHWLICDIRTPESICCFDIEKETFQPFPSPPGLSRGTLYKGLRLLENRLCICDNSSDSDLVIWVMKEYGVKESWTKDVVIRKTSSDLACLSYDVVSPLKVWKNGDILLLWRDDFLYSYNRERKTLEKVRIPSEDGYSGWPFATYDMMLHVASFLSLKDFVAEKVDMF